VSVLHGQRNLFLRKYSGVENDFLNIRYLNLWLVNGSQPPENWSQHQVGSQLLFYQESEFSMSEGSQTCVGLTQNSGIESILDSGPFPSDDYVFAGL
jgi:hypothetical protein